MHSYLATVGRETYDYGCSPEFPYNSSASKHWRYHGAVLMRLALALQAGEWDTALELLAALDRDIFEYTLD